MEVYALNSTIIPRFDNDDTPSKLMDQLIAVAMTIIAIFGGTINIFALR